MMQRDKTWLFITLAIMAALATYPAFGSFSGVSGLRDILLFALFAVSLDLFWGRTGVLSASASPARLRSQSAISSYSAAYAGPISPSSRWP